MSGTATAAEEKSCFEGLWSKAPTENGFLLGAKAVSFLSASHLPTERLRTIWSLCDKTAPWGKLQKEEFFNACKLVAVAQSGLSLDEAALKTKTPLPDMGLLSTNTGIQNLQIDAQKSGERKYPVFAAAAPGYKQDEWDEIGCDLTCAVESCYLDDLKTAVEQAEAAQIPRNYPFPDEEEVQLVDTVIKLLAEVDPQPDAAGAAAAGAGAGAGAGVGAIMPINDARRLLGRKGKNMSDDDVKGLLELAKENHLSLKDLSIRRLLIMRYNSKKIRAGWASKNMPRLGGEDDQGAESHAAEMALAFAATARLDKILADGNAQVDKAKADGDSDMADALRSSMDLEVEFHRQQQSTWEQWQLQQEQAASEAKEKAGTKRGGGSGGAAAAAAAATKPRRQESSLDEECPICFDTFEDASKTPCNHIFCKVCILDWLSHTESCPMCRADMSVGQLVPK
eukprot:gene3809-14411_t